MFDRRGGARAGQARHRGALPRRGDQVDGPVVEARASGLIETPYGTIEFTHTKRGVAEIVKRTLASKRRPLRITTKRAAIRDLLRVGRNANMMDRNELNDKPEGDDA